MQVALDLGVPSSDEQENQPVDVAEAGCGPEDELGETGRNIDTQPGEDPNSQIVRLIMLYVLECIYGILRIRGNY